MEEDITGQSIEDIYADLRDRLPEIADDRHAKRCVYRAINRILNGVARIGSDKGDKEAVVAVASSMILLIHLLTYLGESGRIGGVVSFEPPTEGF